MMWTRMLLIAVVGACAGLWAEGDNPTRLETRWEDLKGPDPGASRALLEMSRTPTETVAFLKTKLQPLKLDEARLSELLEALGSDDKAVWEPAFDTFEYFDPRLAMDLEVLMDLVVDTPTRQRLVEALCSRPKGHLEGKDITLSRTGKDSFNFRADNGSWWAEHKIERLGTGWNRKPPWSRATRAIVLLESIGTPEAIAILRDMATGHPDTAPTKVAQEALKKLADTPPAE